MMDRFENMQTFVSVVETGGISAAADRMKIAKSAVSRRIGELEDRLGVRLFHRTTRRFSLTESGRSFHQHCLRILADLDEVEQSLSSDDAALKGTLKIAAPLSFGLRHLAPIINEFMESHPQLLLDLDLSDRQIDLIEEGIDVAIRIGRLADSSLIARRLAPIRSVVCASPSYLERFGIPQTAQDLSIHQCLRYSNLVEKERWQYQAPDGSSGSVKVPIRMLANSGDYLLEAALAGLGIVVEPVFIAYEAIEQGRLIPVLTDYSWSDAAAYAVYPTTRHLSRRVRVMIDFLLERFGEAPYWDRCLQCD
jgi:DNA-binding transcriptional LysR family regulator